MEMEIEEKHSIKHNCKWSGGESASGMLRRVSSREAKDIS
jgi:hypothetical protein